MQATPRHQTYLERPPGADLPPKKVCNLDPMAPRPPSKRQLPDGVQTYDAVGRRASFAYAVAVRYVKRHLAKPADAVRQNSICVATPTPN